MELYFKDLDGDGDLDESMNHLGVESGAAGDASAEDVALAELTERVSAARLVY